MSTTYPTGYGRARVSFDELKRLYSGGMEPEYAHRLFAWPASRDGEIGIGSGWRPTPSNVSQASKLGRSFHQTQTFIDGSQYFCAVDLVVPTDEGHSSGAVPVDLVPLQESTEAKTWGVHVNVGQPGKPGFESWHLQPVEIDGWQSWVDAGRHRPARDHDVPGAPEPIEQPSSSDAAATPFAPEFGNYGEFPGRQPKADVYPGYVPQPDDLVRYLQAVMRNQCKLSLEIDGFFGPRTQHCVKQLRQWNGLAADTGCDSATWACIDAYAAI